MCTCLQNFPLRKFEMKPFNCCLLYYTCTVILCLHSEVEGNSTNVLSSWHCNVDTQFHLSVSFIDSVCAPLKSYHHSCKYKFNGIIFFISVSQTSSRSVTSFNLSMLVCYCNKLYQYIFQSWGLLTYLL